MEHYTALFTETGERQEPRGREGADPGRQAQHHQGAEAAAAAQGARAEGGEGGGGGQAPGEDHRLPPPDQGRVPGPDQAQHPHQAGLRHLQVNRRRGASVLG